MGGQIKVCRGQSSGDIVKAWGSATVTYNGLCSGMRYYSVLNGSQWDNYKYYVNGVNVTDSYEVVDGNNITVGRENGGVKMSVSQFYVKIDVDNRKIYIYSQEQTCGPQLSVSLRSKKLYQNADFVLEPAVTKTNIPDSYSIKYEWYDDSNLKISEASSIHVNTSEIGTYNYRLVTTLLDESDETVLSRTTYSTIQVLAEGAVSYPMCYDVQRYIDGEYYDTYELCTDAEGNINIDMEDGDNDFVYINTTDHASANTCWVTGSVNGSRWCCSNMSFYFNENILCNNFVFNGKSNNSQCPNMSFVNNGTIDCENMSVSVIDDRDYFKFSCSSQVYANDEISIRDGYSLVPVNGVMVAPKIIIANGNNTGIEFSSCSYVRAETLELRNEPNRVTVEGHVVANNINSSANIILEYDGSADNDAIVTVGSLNSNVVVVCKENTVVNLCENPHLETADAIGYFGGTVIYNTSVSDGWNGDVTPVSEGDINYHDNSSNYWTYKHAGLFETLRLIGGYSSYDNCMNELNMASLLGMDDDPFIPKGKELKMLYENINPCSEEYESNKIQIREMGGKWFRVINGELIYCENDN